MFYYKQSKHFVKHSINTYCILHQNHALQSNIQAINPCKKQQSIIQTEKVAHTHYSNWLYLWTFKQNLNKSNINIMLHDIIAILVLRY